jgi:glutamate-ammonia-ligase adenylyltransferase
MNSDSLVSYLDSAEKADEWLATLGVEDRQRAHQNLVDLARSGVTIDLLTIVCRQLSQSLASVSDPDMALNNLDRFFSASRSPLSLASLFERDPEAMPTLLQIFSTSQYLSDLLIRDPESFDLLRLTEGQPVSREVLVDEICNECAQMADDRAVAAALRRYKRRETLRIAYGDIIGKQHIATVTRQISFLADAICEAALRTAWRTMKAKRGTPRRPDGERARFVVLALGKLGGAELNYSSDIDLILISDGEGTTDSERPVANQEFFERLTRAFVKLLTESTELGSAYRVDLRLRPDGDQGPAVISAQSALRYYDVKGRTWERQAFVKARAIAGDVALGSEFLDQLKPWIYRRYLNRADITGIKALKRRIEQRATREGDDARNIKTGRGGIRDIEFVIQFLQLLNGADLPNIRTGNTLYAISCLEEAGCLTLQERTLLEENYAFLRKLEHRLQIMFDLRTHTIPEAAGERARIAKRMGFHDDDDDEGTALERFSVELQTKSELNRRILDHLLHDAFGGAGDSQPESDLVLDPHPSSETINRILTPYGFRDLQTAYQNLVALSDEKIPFLSTRRCRHFLAAIAHQLLTAISATPDPDATLVNLDKVSDSLGGKGILWELFSFNPPCLRLYVQLCASSSYLSGILTSNPGMIDELMDSLMLDTLPSQETLERLLEELCRGAEDLDPILHSFKISHHLSVGVRDILGKEDIRATHRELSDIAEVCLQAITRQEWQRLTERYGEPSIHGGPLDGGPCSLMIVAMGKLGGREPNYHSDLDVVFLYEAHGMTRHARPNRRETTTNQHFFSQLGQRIIKVVNHLGPYGRLYELDPRLRPTGKSGALAVSLEDFAKYFASGQGQLWERQALCKARVVYGSSEAAAKTQEILRNWIKEPPWQADNVTAIYQMRLRLEEHASKRNLKRGTGGTVDVEFIVQMLQLRHAAESDQLLVPGTLDAIAALGRAGHLEADDAGYLAESYRFLRSIESGLRLMNTTARHDLPADEFELCKLAYLLGIADANSLEKQCLDYMRENRARFERIFERAER